MGVPDDILDIRLLHEVGAAVVPDASEVGASDEAHRTRTDTGTMVHWRPRRDDDDATVVVVPSSHDSAPRLSVRTTCLVYKVESLPRGEDGLVRIRRAM